MTGIFDSGCGGLSVLKEMLKALPGESYVYFSDNAHCPYGEKTPEYILERGRVITRLLMDKGCDLIVVACNTATAAAIAGLRAEFPQIPFVGMEPAIKPAAAVTKSGVVGVLATAGTLGGEKYHTTRDRYAEGVKVVEQVGKGFVELVEKGCLEGPEAEKVVRESVRPLVEEGADTLVLGCTHYPFLAPVILKVAKELCPGRAFTLIDPAPAVARRFVQLRSQPAGQQPIASRHPAGRQPAHQPASLQVELLSNGDDASLRRLYASLLA